MAITSERVGWLVFSKDRPLQLDAGLTSLTLHCPASELGEIVVLYAASTRYFEGLYAELAATHPTVTFRRERRFKDDVVAVASGFQFIAFVVDDTVFVRDFSMAAVIGELAADQQALGFSLRLGTNTTYCYPLDAPQPLPAFEPRGSGVLAFDWSGASYDFGYPVELSSSVYRTVDLLPLLKSLPYRNPNTLEAELAARARLFAASHPGLLCLERSAAFSIPANIVQDVALNRASPRPSQSIADLAAIFERGGRIDVGRFYDFPNTGCHQDVPLEILEPVPARPAVSVVIPCFGQAEYLPEAVSSVIRQTFEDWEIVIVDDGSTDDTAAVAERLIRSNPESRIQLLRQENRGLAGARNAGIAKSTGRFILPLDADDMLEPTMLARTVDLLMVHPEVGIAYTDLRRFGAEDRVESAADFDPDLIAEANQLNYCSLFRRGIWCAARGYNPNMVYGYEDWDFWVACVERGYVARRIPEPLFLYRVRPGSMITRARAHDAELLGQIRHNHPALYRLPSRLRRRSRMKVLRWKHRMGGLLTERRHVRPPA
ncbi:MAG: glycosyltransferase family A protein [Chloroflexota bacterium]